MSTTVKVQIQQRIDTAANWTTANPTLLAGEVGWESDTKKYKIGDGSTAWASLAYAPGSGGYTAGTGVSISASNVITASAVALTQVFTAANQTAHLALTTQEGDVVVRSDENKSYVRNSGTAGSMADFTLLATPTDAVLSVNGQTGAITADQLAAAIESASDSNTFTDADHSKLNGIEASATVDQTGAEIKTAYESESDTNAYTDAEKSKLAAIEASATGDQTGAEIKTAYEAESDTNAFTDADHSKLDGIAASANNYAISSDLLDEDDMLTDSATKVPSQQSVKAFSSNASNLTSGTIPAARVPTLNQNTTGSAGSCTGNAATATSATTATNANHISVADNESTNENNLIPFIEDALATGNVGLESDGDFHYNPSTGKVTATTFTDAQGPVRSIPQNSQSGAYTLVAADAGKHILASGNITWTDSTFSAGQAVTIVNNTGGDLTITKGTNMYNIADATNANRTLGTRGIATLLFTAADTCYISGSPLS